MHAWLRGPLLLAAALLTGLPAHAQPDIPGAMTLSSGTSRLVTLPRPVERVSVAHPGVVDVVLTNPRELYVLGRGIGLSNIMLWSRGSPVSVIDVQVEVDVSPLRRQIARLLPTETAIDVQSAADSVVLSGTVSSVVKAEQALALAQGHVRALARQAYPAALAVGAPGTASPSAPSGAASAGGASGLTAAGAVARSAPAAGLQGGAQGGAQGGPHVINLLQIQQPQQVMLEVKVAEVSRNLLDQLGVSLNFGHTSGSVTYGLVTQALQDVFGRLIARGRDGVISLDAKAQNGLIRVLAEPNIVAMSGHEGSFLAGGKVFIPVARDSTEGRSTITLEEKEYGVGLRFLPQVLDDDVVQLRVAPEVSELTKTGSPFLSAGGATTVLPSFSTRRASTTVLLRDGQSLAIAGLIKNNVNETLTKFPFLGDLPVLGALFRSKEFQNDRSELLFIVTPRLVKALPAQAAASVSAEDPAGPPHPQALQAQQVLKPGAGEDPRLPDRVRARPALGATATPATLRPAAPDSEH